jgi:hypothetical protein
LESLGVGLGFIYELTPVQFDWNTRNGDKVDITEFGFIAQDLQDAQDKTGITVPGLVSDKIPDKLQASAGTLLPVIVQAIKDLSDKINDLDARITTLELT